MRGLYHNDLWIESENAQNIAASGLYFIRAYMYMAKVSFENWQGSEDYIEPTLKSFGDKAPRNIGPCGYAGYEGMFVMGGALNAGLTGIGLGLDFYRNWNADWFNPTTYTKKVSDVDINRLVSCADGVMTSYPDSARHYLAATGDSAGVKQTVNGEVVLNCYQDKWFVSPACRNDPQNCATLLTSRDGWGMSSMIQQAFFHNMPIAFAGTSEYTVLNRELQSTTYWWTPDTTFVSDNASRIIFPDYSPSEQKRNIFRTMKDNTPLSKWAAGGIEVVADKALAIAEAMFLAGDDVTKLLKSHLQLATPPDAWVTACEWLKNSEAQWSDWMPNETACTAGKGLVDWNLYAEAAGMRPGRSQCHRCGNGTGQEERWTTSQMVLREGQETWIQVQGSDNISYCGCVAGAYLWNGLCETCIEGSICEGSSKLLLQKGYFSWATEPGMVYKCFGESARCPGGEPGTCAFGRDTTSIACAVCQPGLHEKEGICVECGGGDYALVISVTILGVCAIAVLYLVLMGEGQKSKQPGSLLVAALGMGQMVTIVQQLTVVQQFKIDWGEPFASILVAMELMAFDMDMISVGCVAQMDPVTKFTMRTLLVLVFFGIAAVVHFAYLAWHRGTSGAKGLQISLLARTVGTLFMVFFISLCSSLLAPFRCDTHPNGLQTVQAYHGVYCNGEGEHLSMAIVGACACLLPLGFLAICFWVIIIELPKRLLAADVKFIRACSFLFMRFRPGAELFSVLFLIRNALVVLCPLLPGASAKVVSMNLLLYASLCGTAFSKPWRAMLCNFLDMMLIVGMLVILDMGSLFVEDNDAGTTMIICRWKPASRKPAGAVVTHACGASLYLALVVAYVVYALYSYFTQPIIETYQAIEAKQFGVMDLHFNISCPTCIPLTSTDVINSTTELFRVWQGYDRVEYPHCAAAPEDEFVADQEATSAKLCYSSDDISERSGVVVMLWNMTSGGQGNRAEVLVTGPDLRVRPLPWSSGTRRLCCWVSP
ncbi:unnamed protein product [Effrenium voratum]|nr:unnamed protein product [Effrenium voratum]